MSPVENRVEVIRCIRTYDSRRLGLKEAKDITDSLDNGGMAILEVDPQINPTFKTELRKFNLVV
jgi:ribosomal protein L7/L12